MTQLPAVFDDPVALALLTLAIAAVVMYQRTLSWREYQTIHQFKLRVLPFVDRYTSLFVVARKGGRDDAEYLQTVSTTPRETFGVFRDGGASPHLVNSIKARTDPDSGERQYAVANLVWSHADGTQTEAYLFATGDGGTDVYAHHEYGVRDPKQHYEDAQQRDGDIRGVVTEALTAAADERVA